MAKLHLHSSTYRHNDYIIDYEAGDRFERDYFFGSNSWWQTKAKER